MVLRYKVQDHIATVTLDRPEVKNALNRELYAQLEQAFRDAHSDPSVRCVVLTGEGSAFCSGDDVREIMLAPSRETIRPPDCPAAARATPNRARRRRRWPCWNATGPLSPPFTTEDHHEGAQSFVEQRDPTFAGR